MILKVAVRSNFADIAEMSLYGSYAPVAVPTMSHGSKERLRPLHVGIDAAFEVLAVVYARV